MLRELCDVLESNYLRKNLKLLYKYVLIKIIEDFQIQYEDEKNLGNEAMCKIYFPPLDNGLVEKIYKEYGVEYNGRVKIEEIGKKDETNHPEFLIKYGLEDIDGLFWDDVFDRDEIDIDYIDGLVNECIDGLEQGEYIKWDLEPLVDLMSHDTKERYFKARPLIEKVQEKVETIVAGEIMQEITQDKNPLMKNDLLMIFVKLAFRYREMKWISLRMKTVEIHI